MTVAVGAALFTFNVAYRSLGQATAEFVPLQPSGGNWPSEEEFLPDDYTHNDSADFGSAATGAQSPGTANP